MSIGQGEVFGFLGANGAGKTTTIRMLCGLTKPTAGRASIDGLDVWRDRFRIRSKFGYVSQRFSLYGDLTVRENLRFFAAACDVRDSKRVAAGWLERVALARVADMPVRQFSRGMRQRLALARTFLNSPRLLLLDEPFTSLDDRAIAMLSELLVEARQRGATILLSTHQLREALSIASHVVLLENGRVRYAGERTQEMLDDSGFLYRVHTELGV